MTRVLHHCCFGRILRNSWQLERIRLQTNHIIIPEALRDVMGVSNRDGGSSRRCIGLPITVDLALSTLPAGSALVIDELPPRVNSQNSEWGGLRWYHYLIAAVDFIEVSVRKRIHKDVVSATVLFFFLR
jgi:hypothetical protein